MAIKTYKAKTKLTVPLVVGNKIKDYIEFSDENHTFTTPDNEIQKALENSPAFGKHYVLFRTVTPVVPSLQPVKTTSASLDAQPPVVGEWQTFEQITDWQNAKELLRAHPYNIPYQSIATPEAILRKAEELKIKFPNLRLQ